MFHCHLCDGPDESSQYDEKAYIDSQPDLTTALGKREFSLHRRIPGNDALNAPCCVLNDTICDLCLFFVASSLSKQHKDDTHSILVYNHYSSLRALRNSARTGCELCLIILESSNLEEDDRMVLAQSSQSQTGAPRYIDAQGRTPQCHFGPLRHKRFAFTISPLGDLLQGRSKDKVIEFEFMLAKDESDCLALPYQIFRNVLSFPSISPSSQESFDQIRQWHDKCIKEHIKCLRQDMPLPTRLLDVFSKTGNGVEGVKLVETRSLSNPPSNTRYVALSYCWGGWTGLITTRENLESMIRNIPYENLPAVVKDAIYVCRRYGIQYLWVDAFCICQDDAVEWQKEAVNMENVYGGCQFVLSVLTSSKASEGFLKERNSRPVPLGRATVSYGTWSDSVKLFVRKIPRTLDMEFEHSPLNRRAWPLQEKVLGPAVLHYGRDQLIWECNTAHLCSETRQTSARSPTVIRTSDVIGTDSSVGMTDLWDTLIEEFASRNLTYKKDRLPALSGIASKLRKCGARSGPFVGGMWETDIESQLTWHTDDITRTISFSAVQPDLRISTWSWAYRDVPVCFDKGDRCCSALEESAKFHFEDSRQERKSNSEYLVKNCPIIFRGFIQKVSYKAISLDSQTVKFQNGDWRYLGLPGHHSKWWFDQQPVTPGQYYCLRLLECQKDDGVNNDYEVIPEINYLVLQKPGRNKIASRYEPYIRVGVLMLYEISENYFNQPYPDIFCKNGKPLLTDGEWEDIALV